MKNKKLINFIIFVPFAISIGAFILYFKYLFSLKGAKTLKITELMEASLVRYRNIGVFCLLVGVILLFIKTLYDYFKIDKVIKNKEENVLDKISNKKLEETNKYSFDENSIISDLLSGKTLQAKFIGSDLEDRVVKFKNYNKKDNIIEFYDETKPSKKLLKEEIKEEYVVKEKYDTKNFKKCKTCKNIIAKDSLICIHCGTVLKPNKLEKNRSFDPVKFVVNMIVILLCIILLLLCFNKIKNQSEINRNNFNINIKDSRN